MATVTPATRSAREPSRSWWSDGSTSTCRRSAFVRSATRWARCQRRVRRTVRLAHGGRGHRDERQDDGRPSPGRGPASRRPSHGSDRDRRGACGRRAGRALPDDARSARSRPPVGEDARRRRDRGGDGGLLACARPRQGRRRPLRRGRLHESVSGSPRPSRDDGAVLRGEGIAVHRGAQRPRRREPRRYVGAEAPGHRVPLTTYGLDPSADIRGEDVRTTPEGLSLPRGRARGDAVRCAAPSTCRTPSRRSRRPG